MKILKLFQSIALIFLFILCIASCGESNRDVYAIKALAEKHVQELEAPQLLEEFILSVDNDTIGVCYALVLPKQSLVRLMKKETYATPGGLKKMREILVKRYMYGILFVDSCIEDKKNDKDWLISNTVNEPVNPIWEQIIK